MVIPSLLRGSPSTRRDVRSPQVAGGLYTRLPHLSVLVAGGGTVGILSWIVVGLIAGVIAKLLMPGRDPGGCIITMLIGIAGAILGGFIVGLFVGGDVITGVNVTTVIVAVLGAIILLLLYRLLLGRRASSP